MNAYQKLMTLPISDEGKKTIGRLMFNPDATKNMGFGELKAHGSKIDESHFKWDFGDPVGKMIVANKMTKSPDDQISNHYEDKYWDEFHCEEKETADEWDGHTEKDVLERLMKCNIENK